MGDWHVRQAGDGFILVAHIATRINGYQLKGVSPIYFVNSNSSNFSRVGMPSSDQPRYS